jgi:hypothetical protein
MAKPVTSGARLELAFALELQRLCEARFATRRVAASHDERASAFTRHRRSGKLRAMRLRVPLTAPPKVLAGVAGLFVFR